MAGKHSRAHFFRSPVGIVSSAAVGVALAVGGTMGAVHLAAQPTEVAASLPIIETSTGAPSPSITLAPSPTASPSATAKPTGTASPQRASRSKTRTTSPTASPKPTATRKPTTASTVVDSGTCGASFYDEGQMTANGEVFDPDALTAASKTLAFNTRVRVINPSTGKSVVVRINDRGPYIDGRCLDLSRAAFATIASVGQGALTVKYEVLK